MRGTGVVPLKLPLAGGVAVPPEPPTLVLFFERERRFGEVFPVKIIF